MSETLNKGDYKKKLVQRQRKGALMKRLYAASFLIAIVTLILLALTIANEAFGFVVVTYSVEPEQVSERPVEDLTAPELADVLFKQQPGQLVRIVAENVAGMDLKVFAQKPLSQSLAGKQIPAEYADKTPTELSKDERPAVMAQILAANLPEEQLYQLVETAVLKPTIDKSWTLFDGLLHRQEIEQQLIKLYPDESKRPDLEFKSWLRLDLLTTQMSANPLISGVRTALLGTIYLVIIVVLTAFPIGIAAAIYLEEYADKTKRYNRLIETNIRNLAGVPSIIYGLLGLQLFVRFLGEGAGIFNGAFLGLGTGSGRTLIAAGLTLALLVLPVIIITAQEAIRAVPPSYREASYGLGATQWQTIWKIVLPSSLPGILTGIILSLSRAVGETAPLVVVGASTFIVQDPDFFSRFTALPIQIYNLTAQPQPGFRELAAATILILLAVLIAINLVAFVLRNRARRSLQQA